MLAPLAGAILRCDDLAAHHFATGAGDEDAAEQTKNAGRDGDKDVGDGAGGVGRREPDDPGQAEQHADAERVDDDSQNGLVVHGILQGLSARLGAYLIRSASVMATRRMAARP